jgi:hypothetical protein
MSLLRTLARLLVALVVALPGCIASPQPSPPNLTDAAIGYGDSGADIMDGHRVTGRPGAVEPAEGAVVLTNLDEERAIVAEPVRADGSFDVIAQGVPGSVFRLQARNGSARSAPFDFTIAADARALVPVEPALEGCFVVAPAYELDFGDVRVGTSVDRTLRVENRCPDAIELEPTRRRETSSPFSVVSDATATVPPGGAATITLRVTPLTPGALEGTIFVEARAPVRDRRPITLFVRALP